MTPEEQLGLIAAAGGPHVLRYNRPWIGKTVARKMGKFNLMRYPVLMEDEGRHELVLSGLSHQSIETWLAENAKDTDYFRRSDYYIVAIP